jgi:3-deoxy-D-manno-octulosonate 8-phosphate phosphatase (KDO 8-P phosphatase)
MMPPVDKILPIRLLAMDVDGVLTNGAIIWSADAAGTLVETKGFSARDGLGISVARHGELEIAWITGRLSAVVTARAKELGVSELHQRARSKGRVVDGLRTRRGLGVEAVAYLGDDLNDLPAFEAAGLRIAVADAAAEVIAAADWVTQRPGGDGAVREVIETILGIQERWNPAVRAFLARLDAEAAEQRSEQ